MKNKILIALTTILFISCFTKQVISRRNFQKKLFLSDTISPKNDISYVYHKGKDMDSLSFKFKIDKRSFIEVDNYKLQWINLSIGCFDKEKDSLISFRKKVNKFSFNRANLMVSSSIIMTKEEKLDSINFLYIEPFGIQGERRRLSELYTYKNTLKFLDKHKTYLDYNAFVNNVTFKKNYTNDSLNYILVTVKANQSIEELTRFNIKINNKIDLFFRSSIMAKFRDHKHNDKGVRFYDLLCQSPNYVSFKLNVEKLNLKEINKIDVELLK